MLFTVYDNDNRLLQVESRLRQLEGKLLGSESAQPRGKAEPQKYDSARQGAAGALLSAPKAYNADADVVMEPAKAEKKKVRWCFLFLKPGQSSTEFTSSIYQSVPAM